MLQIENEITDSASGWTILSLSTSSFVPVCTCVLMKIRAPRFSSHSTCQVFYSFESFKSLLALVIKEEHKGGLYIILQITNNIP